MTHEKPCLSLDGQVALITGGSRGIGAATVRMFASAGARAACNHHRGKQEAGGAGNALVVNHGIWPPDDVDIDRMSDQQWQKTVAVNLDSTFALVKHAVAQMKKQDRGGNIVLISSTAGQRGEAGHCDYAATKGALISMAKGLSTELAPSGIRVNCVAPCWVETPMTAPALTDEERRKKIHAAIP